uniref:PPM-type phosphatase domain-containing protein n=1 Tax=Pinguiococcus pyrenoidosus TaxID=172671 RepID=A0A7R9UEX3_9STRA|mmetsp:Transcript_8282/g.31143  ORF Transcript_8282/g.31143 Transcript_8282/m.31143 type:complete len:378 (+) Transcript_8282:162-1295(+)
MSKPTRRGSTTGSYQPAPNVQTPKERHHKAVRDQAGSLAQARRRLSVVSDNELVEGVAEVQIEEDTKLEVQVQKVQSEPQEETAFIISQYAGMSKKGYAPYNPRKKNQDSLVMAEDPDTQSLVLVVMDGHGENGDLVSRFLKATIPDTLFSHELFATDIEKAVEDTLEVCEARLLADPGIDCEFSGTTLVMGIIRGNTLTVANVGDSRLTMGVRQEGSDKLNAEPVSLDHKPDLPSEKERIERIGGRVFAVKYDDGIDGPARVWLADMDIPGLAMSRSLGDTVAHSAGVISSPEFFTRRIDPASDAFLVIASDGLWEFMSDQEVVDIANACSEPRIAVDTLIQLSTERWMKEEQVVDDTTVAVAWIGDYVGDSSGKV